MSIWTYKDQVTSDRALRVAANAIECVFCRCVLSELKDEYKGGVVGKCYPSVFWQRTFCCPLCGWWKIERRSKSVRGILEHKMHYAAAGVLREFSIGDQSLPLQDIRSYIVGRYESRFDIDPWRFEQVVASVYRDLGFHSRATARSGDDGIDVILEGRDGVQVGVQVKRSRRKIKVEQIRSLAGALVLNGITKGIFVTTASYQSGAAKTAERFALRGIPIELYDAVRFFDALTLGQRTMYENSQDKTAPFASPHLVLLDSWKSQRPRRKR